MSLRPFPLAASILQYSTFVFFCYCAYQYHKHRRFDFFKRRGISIQWYFLICSFLLGSILNPTNSLLDALCIDDYPLTSFIISVISMTLGSGAATALVARIFLLFMNIQRTHELGSMGWKRQINEKIGYTNSWVLKYLNFIGNTRKIWIALIIDWFFTCGVMLIIIIATIYPSFNHNNNNHVSSKSRLDLYEHAWNRLQTFISTMFVIKVLFASMVVYKTREFDDRWFLGNELKLVLIGCITAVVATFTSVAISAIFDVGVAHPVRFFWGLWYSFTWYVTVIWVINKNLSILKPTAKLQNKNVHASQALMQLIQSASGYDKVIRHLQKEFSMENLVFITISVQFRDILLKCQHICENESNLIMNGRSLVLPNNIPISSVISGYLTSVMTSDKQNEKFNDKINNNVHVINGIHGITTTNVDRKSLLKLESVGDVITNLYTEYIERDRARYEVNISDELRKEMELHYVYLKSNILNNENKNKLIEILNTLGQICHELFTLIVFSYVRMKAIEEAARKKTESELRLQLSNTDSSATNTSRTSPVLASNP